MVMGRVANPRRRKRHIGSNPILSAKYGRFRWAGWQLVLKTRVSDKGRGSTPQPSAIFVPVAQLDKAAEFYSAACGFDSYRGCHF